MAKANLKPAAKLTKAEIDEKIKRLWVIESIVPGLVDEAKDIKRILESQYVLGPNEKETIYGHETYFEKVPVQNGKDNYDVEKLRPFLKAIRAIGKVIKRVEVVDTKALDELVKHGKLPETVLNTCRNSKWTFKSLFKRNEVVAQGLQEKKAQ